MLSAAAAAFVLTGCNRAVDKTFASYDFPVQMVSSDLDGSFTLRAWGKARTKKQALEQARKNAVREIIFKGVPGTGDHNKRPLLTGVNDAEKYEAYFNAFFKDYGPYREFTSTRDEKLLSHTKSESDIVENWSAVVRVDRARLKAKLIADGIINP